MKDDWLYVSMVIDRLLLWVYTAVCIVGAMGMLLNAPALYDDKLDMGVARLEQ